MNTGKLIIIWNPIQSNMGATTVSIGLASALAWFTLKDTLLTSISGDESLELYIKEDVKIKYTLDNLKIFQDGITSKDIKLHSTELCNKLDVIGGYKLDKGLIDSSQDFHIKFIEEALKEYEYLVLDISNTFSEEILERADLVFAMVPFDPRILERLYEGHLSSWMLCDKVTSVFNKLPLGLEVELKSILNRYDVKNYAYLPVNKYIHYHSTISNNLYEFIRENLNKTKQIYVQELMQLYEETLQKTSQEFKLASIWNKGSIFNRIKETMLGG